MIGLSYLLPHLPFPELFRAFGLVFLGFVVIQFLRYIVRAPRVDFEVLCAGIATYLLLGITLVICLRALGSLGA